MRLQTVLNQLGLQDVLTWLDSTLTGTKLLEEIDLSSVRISELIQSMKDYSYMDRAPLQEIDLHEGIESTLIILKHKLKYGIVVHREYEKLSRICAYGRELNQVWTNLIDNAIDAMEGKGEFNHPHATRRRSHCGGNRRYRCRNSARSAIAHFEPFFTTKGVGKGTGLGLDIARRIVVQRHHGDISVESQPGKTLFEFDYPSSQIFPNNHSNFTRNNWFKASSF